MKVLIIEDEPRAVNQLKKTLEECEFDHTLIAEIDTIAESVEWLKGNPKPDLIFMDIQLADGLSFEIFQKVNVTSPIIFTTAFDQYAIQAFKVNSIDYLLKPIKMEDMQAALHKFQAKSQNIDIDPKVLSSLLGQFIKNENRSYRKNLLVKEGGGLKKLDIENINFFFSSESITFAATSTRKYIIDESIDALMETLEPADFFKINRGQIVRKSFIKRIEPYFNHRIIIISDKNQEQEFIVSRAKTADFKNWLNS